MPRPLLTLALACGLALFGVDARADEPAPVALTPPPLPSWPAPPRPVALPTLPTEIPPVDDSDESVTRIVRTGEPGPVGARPVWRTRWGLVHAGIWTFAGAYSLAALAAAVCEAPQPCGGPGSGAQLLVPGIGPFIVMARTDHISENVLLATDGLVQLGGVAMFAMGFVFRREVFVLDGRLPTVTVTPLLGAGARGVAVVGTF